MCQFNLFYSKKYELKEICMPNNYNTHLISISCENLRDFCFYSKKENMINNKKNIVVPIICSKFRIQHVIVLSGEILQIGKKN